MPPRWISRACLIALVVGVVLAVAWPMLIYALASASVDALLAPEDLNNPELRQAAYDQGMKTWGSRLFLLVPLATGMIFLGGIGLLFVWVTRLAESTKPTE